MKKIVVAFVILASSILASCGVSTPQDDLSLQESNLNSISISPSPSPDSTNIELENPELASEGARMQNEQTPVATQATIKTSKGDIVIKLYPEEAPNTVNNFITKAASGFYENLTFHRVEDWVIQGGDPDGNGTGGGSMPTELNDVPFKTGSVGVARGGNIQISNDAQFFICTTDCAWLTGQYTNFGEVIQGMDVAKQIAIGDKILAISYQ